MDQAQLLQQVEYALEQLVYEEGSAEKVFGVQDQVHTTIGPTDDGYDKLADVAALVSLGRCRPHREHPLLKNVEVIVTVLVRDDTDPFGKFGLVGHGIDPTLGVWTNEGGLLKVARLAYKELQRRGTEFGLSIRSMGEGEPAPTNPQNGPPGFIGREFSLMCRIWDEPAWPIPVGIPLTTSPGAGSLKVDITPLDTRLRFDHLTKTITIGYLAGSSAPPTPSDATATTTLVAGSATLDFTWTGLGTATYSTSYWATYTDIGGTRYSDAVSPAAVPVA